MSKVNRSTIAVQGTEITIISTSENDFISLTDMLRAKDGDFFIADWLRNRNTVEFLGIWEEVNNPKFNYGEFAIIKLWIIHFFPNTKEFYSVAIPEPISYEKISILGS